MKGLKVLCLLLVALAVSGSSLTKHNPKDVEGTNPEAKPETSSSPMPTPNPHAESDIEPFNDPDEELDPTTTPNPDMEDQTDPNPKPSSKPSPKAKLNTKPSPNPDPEEQTEVMPSPSTTPSPEAEIVLESSPGDPEEERKSDVESIPTTTTNPDEDSQPDTNPSPVSSPKPNPSSKTKSLSSLKTNDEAKTKSSKLTLRASQPHVNKQKPGGPNPESRSQLGALGNGFGGFGIPQSAFPINPRPILTGAGETGINHFPLSGDPTFVELPFQDNFNTGQPSRGITNSLQPLPVSSNGQGSFNDGSQGRGLEIPVNTGLVVNSPNNRPQNSVLFGVPSTGTFDFGQPFGNPTNDFGDTPGILTQRPFNPGSSGFPQGTTPQPPLFINSRPGTPGSFTPNTSGSPSLFLNPNNNNFFPIPTPRPFPPRPSNPPPLFLNPVTQNPASRPSVFLNPQPVNPFIPEDRIPFSLNPNVPNDPSSILFNTVGDTDLNGISPERPSVLFLNPDGDKSPPRVTPSIFSNPQDSPSIFIGSSQPPSRFPLGPTTPSPSLFPRPTTQSVFPPPINPSTFSPRPSLFSPRPTSPSPFFPRPTSPSPLSPGPISQLPFSPRPISPLPFFPRPTSPSPFSPRPRPTSPLPFSPRPRPASPSQFSPRPRPTSPSPFSPRPRPTSPSPFSPRPRPTSPSPFSPRPSFLPRPGISLNSNGNSITPTPFFPNPTLTPSLSPQGPFFPGLTQIPRRRPVRPSNQFIPVSTTVGPSIIVSGGNNRPTLVTPVPVRPGHGNPADNFPNESRGPGFSLQPPKHNYGEGPAYSYGYSVKDPASGDFHGAQEEKGQDGVVRGSYHLLQPDGKTRVVKYSADDYNGFQADVKYLPPSYR